MRRNRESAARNKLIQEMHLDRYGQRAVGAISEATGKKYSELYGQDRGMVKLVIRTAKNVAQLHGIRFAYGPELRRIILNIEKTTQEKMPACRREMESLDAGEIQVKPCGRIWP